jgi:hypothetical protein
MTLDIRDPKVEYAPNKGSGNIGAGRCWLKHFIAISICSSWTFFVERWFLTPTFNYTFNCGSGLAFFKISTSPRPAR